MTVTRFGLQIPSFSFPRVADEDLFEEVAKITLAAEESGGFDSVWVMDHFYQIPMVGPRTDPMFEAYTLLSALAARTQRVSLGTLVTGVTYRNPALLAKMVTSLDVISKGRAILGVGAAWNDDEHDGYGFQFPPVKERMERLEETLQICQSMFRDQEATFSGRYYHLNSALNVPRPLRKEGIPILVGGSGERMTLRLVAKYADACNLFGDLATIRHKLEVLNQHCEAIGRDPSEITKTRLGGLIVSPSESTANEKLREMARARNMDDERVKGYVIAGDADRVIEQIMPFFEAGLDGMIFNTHNPSDLDGVRLAGETLRDVKI